MEHQRHILPSNYTPQSSQSQRSREPLSDSSGNVQYNTLASTSFYHDSKGTYPGVDHGPTRFTLPTLPSQPVQRPLATALELRRAQTRRNRLTRSTNPIVESHQYQSYRARQVKNTDDDQKWSPELEASFLDGEC
jgi:transcriptional enhancer factor